MTHPAVVKAQAIAAIAVENGWKGSINKDFFEEDGKRVRITILRAKRNDEVIKIAWHGTRFKGGHYGFFEKVTFIQSSGIAIKKIEGWPDIIALLKVVPIESRPQVTSVYVKLPFDWQNDDDDFIMSTMVERKLFWYNRIDGKIETDVVMNSKKNRIAPVGHRKLFHFISPVVGFRSVLLDQVLRVG